MHQIKVLDLKDRKILYELDCNARASCSEIAKKVGLSTEVVNYRIKRLENGGIITGYTAMVNLSTLQIINFKICLTIHHLTSAQLAEIIEKIRHIPEVKWIAQTSGAWDVLITVEAKSMPDADRIKQKVLGLFGNSIDKKDISFLVEANTFTRDYLVDRKRTVHSRIIMKKLAQVNIDDLDMIILKRLARNSRIPLIELASELKTSSRVLLYRIKQLELKKIISGYKISIDYEKSGIKFFKTFLYLEHSDGRRYDELLMCLNVNSHVTHDVKVMGAWDLEPEFEVYSDEQFNEILLELKDRFADVISKIDVITISKEHKFEYF